MTTSRKPSSEQRLEDTLKNPWLKSSPKPAIVKKGRSNNFW